VSTVHSFAVHHGARFYENEESLADIVADFLEPALTGGNPAIIAADRTQRGAILHALMDRSVEVGKLQHSGKLLLLDGDQTLSRFMIGGMPDRRRFAVTMSAAIARAQRGRQRDVRMYTQLIDMLWKQGMLTAAVRLELFWNRLANARASVQCGYAMGPFYYDATLAEASRHAVA
jgi:hypothetical protein